MKPPGEITLPLMFGGFLLLFKRCSLLSLSSSLQMLKKYLFLMEGMTSLGIIGYGIVGKATEHGFKGKQFEDKNIHIRWYDRFKESESLEQVCKLSDFIFICLPTPFKGGSNGEIDLAIIDQNLEQITAYTNDTSKVVIIKSTVVPGTTLLYEQQYKKTSFCFNPEFLVEKTFLEDALHPDRIIIGSNQVQTSRKVSDLYASTFPGVDRFITDTTSAEMVKYGANCFLATKVAFANQLYDLCQKLNIQYDEVKKMIQADPRIGDTHFDVTTNRGFGGKCFPKDTVALLAKARELGVDLSVLTSAWEYNLKVREHYDWEEIPFAKTE